MKPAQIYMYPQATVRYDMPIPGQITKPYQCNECSKIFANLNSFITHGSAQSTQNGRHTCAELSSSFILKKVKIAEHTTNLEFRNNSLFIRDTPITHPEQTIDLWICNANEYRKLSSPPSEVKANLVQRIAISERLKESIPMEVTPRQKLIYDRRRKGYFKDVF